MSAISTYSKSRILLTSFVVRAVVGLNGRGVVEKGEGGGGGGGGYGVGVDCSLLIL